MHETDDKPLVEAFLKTKSEASFRKLYRDHTSVLYRLAERLVDGDQALAEDAIQEMWIRAIRGIERFRWQSSLRTWLTGILINCCREYKRSTAPTPEPEDDTGTWIAELHIASKMDVQAALAVMPQGYKEVLLLHDEQGYTHHEIGVLLGISEGTSKSQLFHARKAMRKLMK